MNRKRTNKKIAKIALVLGVIVVALSLFIHTSMNFSKPLKSIHFPNTWRLLFDYSVYTENKMRFLGQILGNVVAYLVALVGIVSFVLVCVNVKEKEKKCKAAAISVLTVAVGLLGLLNGFINFIGEGIAAIDKVKAMECGFIFLLLCVDYILLFAFLAFAGIYVYRALFPNVVKEEAKDDDGSTLVKDMDEATLRRIIREELAKMPAREVVVEKEKVVAPVVEKVVEKTIVKEVPAKEEGLKINSKPRVPFATKMQKAPLEIKEYYNELKNELMAYGLSSRVSIAGDTFRLHRKEYVKITLVGKTMKVYFALNPRSFQNSPIPVENEGDKALYADVPCLLRVKSNLACKRSKILAEKAMERDGFKKTKEVGNVNWVRELKK